MGFAVKALSNQIKRLMSSQSCADDEALTGMQLAVVGYVGDRLGREDVFQRDLELEFNIRRSTATGILQLMEKNGLIRREPVVHDARLKKIVLTEKGFEVRHRANVRMVEMEERLTKGLTSEELRAFFQTIRKMYENIS